MKNLLVPVDFSDYAYNASLFALHLASKEGAKMTLFHTYHIPIVDPMMPAEYLSDLAESAERDTQANMDKLLHQLREYKERQRLADVEIHSFVAMGFAVDEIILASRKYSSDIIVMGRRYTEGMTKILLGSVTSAIVEKAAVPVLVVPENLEPAKPITGVLYACEFDEDDKTDLHYLLELSRPFNSKVHCIHISTAEETGNRQKMQELEKQFAKEIHAGLIEFHVIVSENVADGLLQYADINGISLLAMLTHRRPFFIKLFDRSLTKKIAFKTTLPLLVFHNRSK